MIDISGGSIMPDNQEMLDGEPTSIKNEIRVAMAQTQGSLRRTMWSFLEFKQLLINLKYLDSLSITATT